MKPQNSHAWKPMVYLGLTTGWVVAVLGLLVLAGRLACPEFSLLELLRIEGEATLWIAGAIAYVTVLSITALLKRFYGREFGTYLDNADLVEAGPRPSEEKLCSRCGARFGVHRNDFHAAGFCSRACRNAFARRARAGRIQDLP